jgi:hypothetical protein
MKRHCYTVSLKIRAPFLFPGVNAGRYGLDKVAMRDRDGNLILPQDQLRGVMLEAAQVLLGTDDTRIASLFGQGSGDVNEVGEGAFEPEATRIFFSDLKGITARTDNPNVAYHRVHIDEEAGAAKAGQLVMLEQSASPGEEIEFNGPLVVYAADDEIEFVERLLARALEYPVTVGSHATIGFGRIIRDKRVQLFSRGDKRRVQSVPADDRICWKFRLDRPYLVDATRIVRNAYLGAESIPGGALKGCLARNLRLLGYDLNDKDLAAGLSRVRIGFARKVRQSVPLPLSSVKFKGSDHSVDLLDRTNLDDASVPEFQVDWKPEYSAARECALAYDERVHTGINSDLQVALDEMLYSTIAIEPRGRTIPGGQDPMITDSEFDLFECGLNFWGVSDAAKRAVLSVLAAGLDGLGRTNASANSESFAPASPPMVARPGRNNIRIRTPALLADYSDGENTRDAYTAFWKTILPNSTMREFYARQRLRGGYQSRRFKLPDKLYRNWLLTEPGSVFELDLSSEDCAQLNAALANGVCRKMIHGQDLTWRNCPFVAENGFGEIDLLGEVE